MPKSPRTTSASQAAFQRASAVMPGGVSSPVRAFGAVGGTPIFIREGQGCRLLDIDGNSYIDFVAGYGPLIVGHAHERIVAAVAKAIGRGASFGAPTESETHLATRIISAIPSIEMIRFVNSGTEAVMSALRLARAATGREKIVKMIGGYHGHSDSLLVQAGSGALTFGTPSSPGVPKSVVAHTLLIPFNDLLAAQRIMAAHGDEIAAILVEPVAGNMGVVPPHQDYLPGLRALCNEHHALLILDEVMTGFRVAWGSAADLYGVRADITCLGKIIGGGLPVGAYGGRRNLMEMISPAGPVYQAGTLSGNPLTMSAGLETLEILEEPGTYEKLEQTSARLADGLIQAAKSAGVPLTVNRVGSMLTSFFVREPGQAVTDFASATTCDAAAYARFFHSMLEDGICLAPSQFEAMFVGLAHDDAAIDQTLTAAKRAFQSVQKAGA